jgi:hypothetical protein
MGCRKDSSCACLHRLTLGVLGRPEKWRDCQLSTDSGHRLSYAHSSEERRHSGP